jgi:hypothetical protein
MPEQFLPEPRPDNAGGPALRGSLVAVGGSHGTVHVGPGSANVLTVGRLLEIKSPGSAVVAVVTSVSGDDHGPAEGQIDLLGEIVRKPGGDFFQRGISDYPLIGTPIALLGGPDLKLIYDVAGDETINIGHSDPSRDSPRAAEAAHLPHRSAQ